MVTLGRWSLWGVDHFREVVTLGRWSLWGGGHFVEVVTLGRWSLYRGLIGDHKTKVNLQRWLSYEGGCFYIIVGLIVLYF